MKRIITNLFVVVLLMLSATSWAQSGIKISVHPGDGVFGAESGYCKKWTSTSGDYPVEISVGVNNLVAGAVEEGFGFYPGSSKFSTWNFTVNGCKILSYSFKYKLQNNGSITITAGNSTYTPTATAQEMTVEDVNAMTATIDLSGDNKCVVITELEFVVEPILEVGQVYMFKNARADRSLSADGADDVHTKATDATDTKQQWYVTKDGGYYVLRNLATAKYLKGNVQSSAWSMTDDCSHDYNKFELYQSNKTYNTLHTKTLGDYAYMHDDNKDDNGGYNIVGWSNNDSNVGTHWTITKVDYTDAEIKALLDAVPTAAELAAYQPSLEALFADGACVTPKLTSLSAAQSSDAYAALPAGLQRMVDKVYGGNWEEATVAPAERPNGNNNTNHSLWIVADTWSSDYAKRFRVQMYEPYSIEGEVTSYLLTSAHCNMDNPTGIYANSGEAIYIMVDGDIPEGAELWLAHQSGNGAAAYYNNSAHTQLHKGLNIVTYATDGCQMWINYVVHTYNKDGETIADKFPENRKLSNYKPLKIHIEGGHINGFFNAMGDFRAADSDTENLWGAVDNDEDWDYYKARVALPNDFALLGHRQTLLFPFGTYDSEKEHFGVANADGAVEKALAYHLENIKVVQTPNCYGGSGHTFGSFDGGYPGMGLSTSNGKINIMIEAWDRITYSELATMGVVSASVMDRMNALYPRWTSEGSPAEIYNYGSATVNNVTQTYKDFCQGVDYGEYYNHHACGVGAGSGYMSGGWRVCNYNYNTMGSIIGLIANEAGPTWGPAHEIGHQNQAVFNLNGQTEVTNNLFSNIAVWYMGMGTSRVNGNEGSLESVLAAFNTEDNDLYTNNIWAITQMYYRLWLYYHLAGNNTQFWPRLFELCRQVPLNNGGQISGETSLLRFYKHACDAAGEDLTEFFRAHGFFEVMDNRFVGDYSNATYNTTQEQIDAAIAEIKEKNYPVNYAVLLINDGTSETTKRHDGSTARALWDNNATAEFGSVNDFIDGDVEVLTNYAAVVNVDGSVTMSGGQGGVGFLVFNEKGELVSFSNKSIFKLGDEALKAIVSGKATIATVDADNNVANAEFDIIASQRTALEQLILKAQSITGKVDDTYTKIGYFKGAAVADLASAIAYAKAVYESASGFEAAYDLLYAEYKKVLAFGDCKIPFNPSLTYIITNYGNPSLTMWVNGEKTVRSEDNVDNTSKDARWKFVETSTAGVYNIRTLNNDYIPAVKQSASMTATAGKADDDALYTLEEVMDGVWAIKLSPAEGYRNLHTSWNNVVGWNTSADASRWYLTAVEAEPMIADLTDLEVYVNKTEQLLDEVLGSVTYTKGEALPLQVTTEGSAYYLWSNAVETREGDIANLVDGATDNHFHTDYSSEPASGSHYLAVYLGDNAIERFTFSHTTRSGASGDYPKGVDVYGSNDGTTYKLIGSASGMPQTAGTAWEFDGVMLSSYKYLRFNYHANRGYWHMAEFDITPITGFTATVNDIYNATVDVDVVEAAMNAMLEGKRIVNSSSPGLNEVKGKLQVLQSAYDVLYAQYERTVDARKEELAALVQQSEELISEMGEVAFAQETKLKLTTGNLYCNDPHLHADKNDADYSEKYVEKLTDGEVSTFLHTDYSNTNSSGTFPHYLRVDLGENSSATGFRFTYTTRDNGNNCPTEIEVAGCDKPDGEYTTICTLKDTDTNPLPNGKALVYNSSVISRQPTYRYIRFTITKTEGTANTFFVMSEFGFKTVANEVTVYDAYKSYLTGEQLLTSVLATNSSKEISTNELVTSVPMLNEQIAEQQSVYDALCAVELAASSHTLVVGNAGWATLFLGNSTIIPSTVEAYMVSNVGDSYAILTKVDGVLPACQGVVVKAAAGEYEFVRTTDAAKCDFTANQLMGTLVDTKVETPAYVLGVVDDEVGFYRAVTAGYADGTFLNNANKAYLPMSNTNGAASYSFRFGDDATGVEEVKTENEKVKTICDLTGRRVEAITSPGFYIVNGKKTLVK
ncbi:MAG: M60 family metallopeptidase [Bacteroidaceae bacterium]|nr:M60 family metallopeptidase [Bacteroidaceae bacterium]